MKGRSIASGLVRKVGVIMCIWDDRLLMKRFKVYDSLGSATMQGAYMRQVQAGLPVRAAKANLLLDVQRTAPPKQL